MRIELDPKKTVQQNAAEYFDRAKKLRKKAEGAKQAIAKFAKLLGEAEKKQKQKEQRQQQAEEQKKRVKEKVRKWYEKFRWFISSEDFLCIGGRDATTNEIIIKKHTSKEDLVFHTEAPGSPFFVVKSEGRQIGEATKKEAAAATIIYSRAWKSGYSTTEVYSVSPEQVSKQAQSGQYLTKGAFVISGKRTYYKADPTLAVGKLENGETMAGPLEAIKKNCANYVTVQQDRMKASECAKKIAKYLNADIDDVVRVLPAGGGKPKLPNGQELK